MKEPRETVDKVNSISWPADGPLFPKLARSNDNYYSFCHYLDTLISAHLDKNVVSVMYELCTKYGISNQPQYTILEYNNRFGARINCDSRRYQTNTVYSTAKQAKSDAAFMVVAGFLDTTIDEWKKSTLAIATVPNSIEAFAAQASRSTIADYLGIKPTVRFKTTEPAIKIDGEINYVGKLQELFQQKHLPIPLLTVEPIEKDRPQQIPTFICTVKIGNQQFQGRHQSKQGAKRLAAQRAYEYATKLFNGPVHEKSTIEQNPRQVGTVMSSQNGHQPTAKSNNDDLSQLDAAMQNLSFKDPFINPSNEHGRSTIPPGLNPYVGQPALPSSSSITNQSKYYGLATAWGSLTKPLLGPSCPGKIDSAIIPTPILNNPMCPTFRSSDYSQVHKHRVEFDLFAEKQKLATKLDIFYQDGWWSVLTINYYPSDQKSCFETSKPYETRSEAIEWVCCEALNQLCSNDMTNGKTHSAFDQIWDNKVGLDVSLI